MDVWTSKRQYYQASATQPRALQGEAAAADSAHQQRTPPRRQTCLPTKCSSNPKAVHACATRQTPADDACRSRWSRPLDRPLESRYSTAGTVNSSVGNGLPVTNCARHNSSSITAPAHQNHCNHRPPRLYTRADVVWCAGGSCTCLSTHVHRARKSKLLSFMSCQSAWTKGVATPSLPDLHVQLDAAVACSCRLCVASKTFALLRVIAACARCSQTLVSCLTRLC